jgi:hypothetical protein
MYLRRPPGLPLASPRASGKALLTRIAHPAPYFSRTIARFLAHCGSLATVTERDWIAFAAGALVRQPWRPLTLRLGSPGEASPNRSPGDPPNNPSWIETSLAVGRPKKKPGRPVAVLRQHRRKASQAPATLYTLARPILRRFAISLAPSPFAFNAAMSAALIFGGRPL